MTVKLQNSVPKIFGAPATCHMGFTTRLCTDGIEDIRSKRSWKLEPAMSSEEDLDPFKEHHQGTFRHCDIISPSRSLLTIIPNRTGSLANVVDGHSCV